MTEKHFVRVKYAGGGLHPVRRGLDKPMESLSAAMLKARQIVQGSEIPVSVIVQSVTGTIKFTVTRDAEGSVTEKPGAV
ncbi:MAG: hypothetical protein ABSH24_29010 [Bryobacteraceae bacterium]|jgi:hypothetical protein